MTKGQAYERYNLSLENANFNPDEVADDKFLAGCIELHKIKQKMETNHVEVIKQAMSEDMGEEMAEHHLRLAFLAALADLIHSKDYPFWMGIAVAELFDNGCTVMAVMRAMDKVNDYLAHINNKEDKDND